MSYPLRLTDGVRPSVHYNKEHERTRSDQEERLAMIEKALGRTLDPPKDLA